MAEIELDLSIVTTISARPHAVKALIKSIWESADPVAFEMCVVAAKPENLLATLQGDFPDLKIKPIKHTRAEDTNRAINSATGRYIMLIDHDVIVKPNCLKTLVDFMDDNPDIGVAGPVVLDAYGKAEPTARPFPSLLALLGQTRLTFFIPAKWKESTPVSTGGKLDTPTETDWLGGGVRIIRKELLEDITLPSKHFGSELAETCFCLLAKKMGWHIFLVPQAQVFHPNPLRYNPKLATETKNCAGFIEVLLFLKKRWFS